MNFNQLLSIADVTGERVKVQRIKILSGPLPVLMRSSDNPQHHVYEALGQNLLPKLTSDMKFVQNFTPSDFQVKNFTPSISPNFKGFSRKKTQKMSENGEIYAAGKNFTLPPAHTALTNSTSG